MSESKASRTLVKSPPELWSEVSSATSLQRHMAQFGEIRITKLDPETAVAWEGEHARGTIRLEASGWGTKVSLTAEPMGASAEDRIEPEAAARVEPERGNRTGAAASARVEPFASDRVEAVASARVEPVASDRVEATATEDPVPDAPHRTTEAQVRGVTVVLERDQRQSHEHEGRWTRRLARTLRRWFGPWPEEHADSVAHTPEHVPEQPATPPAPSEAEQLSASPAPSAPEQPAAPPAPSAAEQPAPVTSGPEQPTRRPTTPVPAVEPAAQQEAPPQPETPSTAALDAALDSLGQAHHRPFSRA